jgi:hypothetical protein
VIDPVTLTIGGVKVPVFFAGPTPGFTGLYQVNATIPTGIAPSPQAPLVRPRVSEAAPRPRFRCNEGCRNPAALGPGARRRFLQQ